MIPIEFEPAGRTAVDTLCQGHELSLSAPRTVLRGVRRIHRDHRPTSFFRFEGQAREEHRPRRVVNALGELSLSSHAVDIQVFDCDQAEPVDEPAALLMDEVVPPVRAALVNTGNSLAKFDPLGRAFRRCRELALSLRERLLFPSKEPRVFDLLAVRQGRERHEADVDSCALGASWQGLWLKLAREEREPLARRCAPDRRCLDDAFDRTVQDYLDWTDLGHDQLFATKLASGRGLREREAVVPAEALEARVAGCFTRFDPPEESLECEVKPEADVLENLAVCCFQRRPGRLERRQSSMLVVQANHLLLDFLGVLVLLQHFVVQPATFFKDRAEFAGLCLGRI